MSSTRELISLLHVPHAYRRNLEAGSPLVSVLDVLVHEHVQRDDGADLGALASSSEHEAFPSLASSAVSEASGPASSAPVQRADAAVVSAPAAQVSTEAPLAVDDLLAAPSTPAMPSAGEASALSPAVEVQQVAAVVPLPGPKAAATGSMFVVDEDEGVEEEIAGDEQPAAVAAVQVAAVQAAEPEAPLAVAAVVAGEQVAAEAAAVGVEAAEPPVAPSAVGASEAPAPPARGMTFAERMNAGKERAAAAAAEAAAAVSAGVGEAVAADATAAFVEAEPAAAVSADAPPPAPPAGPAASVVSAPAAPPAPKAHTFAERMAAGKAAAGSSGAGSVAAPAAVPAAPAKALTFAERMAAGKAAAAPSVDAQAVAPPVAAPAAPMSFAERMAASKAAASSSGVGSVAAPAAVPAAPAKALTFAERMAAGKAAAAPPAAAAPGPAAVLYTAPDGVTFTDRAEFRKYVYTRFYSYSSRTGEVLTKVPGSLAGQPFAMEDLNDCTVRLCDWTDMVQVDRVTRCRVLIAAASESVFLRNCSDCVFTVACKQLRTRDCVRCTIYLYSKTEPVIEASAGMTFAPFNGAYPGLGAHMEAAGLHPSRNLWDRVFDFSKDTDSEALPAPHWAVQAAEAADTWVIDDLEGASGPAENPVAAAAAGGGGPGEGEDTSQLEGVAAYDIRTGQLIAGAKR